MSTAISVDVAVDSRSTLVSYSIDTRSPVERELTDDRLSVDRVSIDCPLTGGRYSGRRTSTEYRSCVGGISASCRWYVGQLSVAYRSTVGGISVNCWSHISRVLRQSSWEDQAGVIQAISPISPKLGQNEGNTKKSSQTKWVGFAIFLKVISPLPLVLGPKSSKFNQN